METCNMGRIMLMIVLVILVLVVARTEVFGYPLFIGCFIWMSEWVIWLFNATINDNFVIHKTAHRYAGGLKMKLNFALFHTCILTRVIEMTNKPSENRFCSVVAEVKSKMSQPITGQACHLPCSDLPKIWMSSHLPWSFFMFVPVTFLMAITCICISMYGLVELTK